MPAEKRRKTATPAAVPELGNPDRKRVLNVLAQRRYRQRRRDRIASLESKKTSQNGSQSPIELNATPVLEHAANLGPSTTSPEDILGVEEHTSPSFDGDLMAFDAIDAIDIDFNPFSGFNFQDPATALAIYGTSNNSAAVALPKPNTLVSSSSSVDPDSEPSSIVFPLTPDVNIDVPLMPTLRAFMTAASLLNIVSNIFDPFALHTSPPTPHPSLPPNLHPVRAQILIPHHPALDIIPWPSVREKLICMLHLPSSQRPPIARGTRGEAIQRIIDDIDDYSSGWRVHGNTAGWSSHHEMAEESWEIGDAFYQHWWFCLDSRIISITNARRRERGLTELKLDDVGS